MSTENKDNYCKQRKGAANVNRGEKMSTENKDSHYQHGRRRENVNRNEKTKTSIVNREQETQMSAPN